MAELHKRMARAAQTPTERGAHYAAARAHERAARDPALAHEAHEASRDARAETSLREKYAGILRGMHKTR